jgi:cyclopropane-fatty-acyl-phospholipid synthase
MRSAERAIRGLLAEAGIHPGGENPWDMRVHDPDFYGRVLAGGSLALGESYMDGWWDCDDLSGMFERLTGAGIQKRVRPASLIFPYVKEQLLNKTGGARRWRGGTTTAQRSLRGHARSYMQYLRVLKGRRQPADAQQPVSISLPSPAHRHARVDTGCGFGGFAKYAAEHHGVEVYGVTLSQEQAAFGQELCKGLPVTIEVRDYRDVTETNFDRVASIGIMEHVGTKNYRAYLRQMARCLKDDGLMVLHTIGSESQAKSATAGLRYIFPIQCLPPGLARATEQVLVLEITIGASYAKTLLAWNANCEAAWTRLPAERYDERFRRMWRYYLLSCAGAFASRSIQLWQLVLSTAGWPGGTTRRGRRLRPAARTSVQIFSCPAIRMPSTPGSALVVIDQNRSRS